MPRLSILIPFLGNRDSLENTLASVLQNRPAEAEVIVALGCDYDDPYQIDEEVRFARAGAKGGLSEIVNHGFRACQAPIVHLLACGATVNEGWTEPAISHFRDGRVASVAPLVVTAEDPRRIWAAGVEYESAGKRRRRSEDASVDSLPAEASASLGPTWCAGFFRRELAASGRGPFDPMVGWAADVDFALRLREAGYRSVFEPASVVQQTRLAESQQQGFVRGRQAERLFWRHAAAYGKARSCLSHAGLVASEFIQSLPKPQALTQAAGRLLACCEWGALRRQQLLLQLPPPAAFDACREAVGRRVDRPHGDRAARQGESAPRRGRTNPPLNDKRL